MDSLAVFFYSNKAHVKECNVSSTTNFDEFVDSRGLSDDEFPHARSGPSKLSSARKWLKATIITGIVTGLLALLFSERVIRKLYDVIPEPKSKSGAGTGSSSLSFDMSLVGMVDSMMAWPPAFYGLFVYTTGALGVVALIKYIVYAVNVIKRQRCFERDVYANDKFAIKIKNRVLTARNIHTRERDVRRKIDRDTRNDDDSFGATIADMFGRGPQASLDDEAWLEAFNAFKNMGVYVNTRQSTLGDMVQQSFVVLFQIPDDVEAAEKLDNLTQSLDADLTRATVNTTKMAGRQYFQFGERTLSSSRDTFMFGPERRVVDDKFAKKTDVDTSAVQETVEYETSAPLSIFPDERAKIEKIKKNATRRAEAIKDQVDNVLTTSGIRANRTGIEVGAQSMLFQYAMPTTFAADRLESVEETLDKLYDVTGTTVGVRGSGLAVTIELPKDLKMPIDIGTMYREAFL